MCRCAPSLVALRNEINARWPRRDKASDGCCGDAAHAARKSDHNANASGYAHALDIDEDIVAGLGPRPLWDTVLPALLRDSRTKYVIYERRIMYPDGTNKPYTGANAHAHHLHLSIKSTATHDTRRWLPASPPVEEEDMFSEQDRELLRATADRVSHLEKAVFDGAPEFGVPSIQVAVTEIGYSVAGYDLPKKPSLARRIAAKLGVTTPEQ